MAYFSTAPAPGRRTLTAKNRVWDFFQMSSKTHPANRRQPAQPRRKPRPTPTKTVAGIPYWPARDPIGEEGGVNLYGFVENDGVNEFDGLGLAAANVTYVDENSIAFANPFDAAVAAMMKAIKMTWAKESRGPTGRKLEHCGKVCCEKVSKKFYYTGPVGYADDHCSSIGVPCAGDDTELMFYHSHPAPAKFSSATDNAFKGKLADREIAKLHAEKGLGSMGLVFVTRLGPGGGIIPESEIQMWVTKGPQDTDQSMKTVPVDLKADPWKENIEVDWTKKPTKSNNKNKQR